MRAGAWYPGSPHRALFSVETTGSPKFPGDPDVYMPCSPTPVGPPRQARTSGRVRWPVRRFRSGPQSGSPETSYGVSILPSAGTTSSAPTTKLFRGSITRPAHSLSTLGREGHPSTTQDSLPAAGQALPDRVPSAGSRCKVSGQVISILLARASWRNCPELAKRPVEGQRYVSSVYCEGLLADEGAAAAAVFRDRAGGRASSHRVV